MLKKFWRVAGWIAVVAVMAGMVFFLALQVLLIYDLSPESSSQFTGFSGDKIGVLSLDGGIFSVESELKLLKEYRESNAIKGLLINVNSPGGVVGPSQELSNAVARFSESGKPVVASVRTVGASGAYYVSSAADTIIANPGSMVGSIGVIMEFMKVKELMGKVGIEYNVLKSGKYKDIGSPFRDMSDDEREVLRNLIMDVYDQFLNHIVEHRQNLSRQELESMADGRIFTGRQAQEKGLIDRLGGQHEARKIIGEATGLGDNPDFVTGSHRRFSFTQTASKMLARFTGVLTSNRPPFRLLYMMPEWGSVRD